MNKESTAQNGLLPQQCRAANRETGKRPFWWPAEDPGKADISYCRKTPGRITMKTPSRFKPLLQRSRFLRLVFALRFSAPFTRWCCSGERGIKRRQRDGSSASAEQAAFSDGKQRNLPMKSLPWAVPMQVPAALAP